MEDRCAKTGAARATDIRSTCMEDMSTISQSIPVDIGLPGAPDCQPATGQLGTSRKAYWT